MVTVMNMPRGANFDVKLHQECAHTVLDVFYERMRYDRQTVYLAECVHLAIEVAWEVLGVFTAFGCLIYWLFLPSLVGRVVG